MNLRLLIVGAFLACCLLAGSPEYQRANDLYQRTEYKPAIATLEKVLNPDADTLLLLGRAYFGARDYAKATETLEKGAQKAPRSAQMYTWLGRAWGMRAETSAVWNQPRYASRAREAFEKVLRDYDPDNGRAFYGLGLIEMDKENLDEALKYFDRTLRSTSAAPSMKTWSHIYSGHILDFKCDRKAAIEHYRKALESGDDSRDARRIANRDLAQPFGGECPQ